MFIDKFNNILSLISKDNKHCYVMGDLNLDLRQTFLATRQKCKSFYLNDH